MLFYKGKDRTEVGTPAAYRPQIDRLSLFNDLSLLHDRIEVKDVDPVWMFSENCVHLMLERA